MKKENYSHRGTNTRKKKRRCIEGEQLIPQQQQQNASVWDLRLFINKTRPQTRPQKYRSLLTRPRLQDMWGPEEKFTHFQLTSDWIWMQFNDNNAGDTFVHHIVGLSGLSVKVNHTALQRKIKEKLSASRQCSGSTVTALSCWHWCPNSPLSFDSVLPQTWIKTSFIQKLLTKG